MKKTAIVDGITIAFASIGLAAAFGIFQVYGQTKINQWVISEDTDLLTDARTATITQMSSKNDRRGLAIRCANGELDIIVYWADYLSEDRQAVTYRITPNPMQQSRWSVSTNNAATFYPGNTWDFLREMFCR